MIFDYLYTQRFQHTAARRRLPKILAVRSAKNCFNTQPPEGGCKKFLCWSHILFCFNTQPPEGGCTDNVVVIIRVNRFQHTAARRRLPFALRVSFAATPVSTHSRPKAAAGRLTEMDKEREVSTHSRPKAAAAVIYKLITIFGFQHTAARRRLRLAIS